jgi:catechol 2,3-dioxygenase-like lactoylglutathione lyase family enzyme
MSRTQVRSETAIETPSARRVDMQLEVVVIPVSDVDRAKRFYSNLGWRLDADFGRGDEFRVVQLTPPGSSCSIHFGTGVASAVPGSAQGLYLIVSDIEYFHQVDKGGHVAAGEEPEFSSAELRAAFRPLRKLI